MTVEFDENEAEEVELEEEEAPRRNPFRIILLLLLVLVLACVVCFVALRNFGDRLPISIPGFPPGQGGAPTATPAVETPTSPPTGVSEVPPEETAGPATEEPTPGEVAPTEAGQLPATEEPGAEPTLAEPTTEPTEELVEEHGEDLVEGTATATAVPVPGPTSTPAPTVVVTIENCDNNAPPTAEANGPYMAMMGKGQAFVTFDGSGSIDPDGTIETYEWDFGDNSGTETGESVIHGYTSTGSYVATLTVTDNCGATSQDTVDVTIVGPTPPSSSTGTPTVTATPQTPPASGTMGFCHRVQYGQTLSGIAWHYGLSLRDLADVNGVSMQYFVIAGQGLFIPTGEITGGSNIYQVQPGDTLNSIAYQCGLTRSTLATANNLAPDASLTPGQDLIIPPWRQVNP